MKKLSVLFVGILLISTSAFSQTRFGIKGGLNFTSMANISSNVDETWKNQVGYQLGIALQFKVPAVGLTIQPELLYSTVETTEKNSDLDKSIKLDYITLPLNFEFGVDMLVFRPFIVASPYVSYAIQKGARLEDQPWDDINRFDYGIGLGAGIDLWKLQVMGKYNWGLGKLRSAGATWDESETYKDATLRGFQLSVAFLF
ncbi:MAG: porin family protein [Bacteroidales bacterium]